MEKIFHSNRQKEEVNLIEKRVLVKDVEGVIAPVLGEINQEGENFIQFESKEVTEEEDAENVNLENLKEKELLMQSTVQR